MALLPLPGEEARERARYLGAGGKVDEAILEVDARAGENPFLFSRFPEIGRHNLVEGRHRALLFHAPRQLTRAPRHGQVAPRKSRGRATLQMTARRQLVI